MSYIRGRCPRLLIVVPSRHQSACGSYLYHGLNGFNGVMSYGGKKRSKSLLLSLGLRPCSPMRMLSHVSELPCLTIPIRLVCPREDGKATKQNSCPWQYKISLQRRLLTITSDLPGAFTRRRISLWLQGSLFLLPTAAILFSEGLEGPARQDWELRHRAAAKTRLEQRPMTEGPKRNAS